VPPIYGSLGASFRPGRSGPDLADPYHRAREPSRVAQRHTLASSMDRCYMCPITASPNSEVFTRVAPSISRSKS
jgi:hypothetical protein